MQRKLIVPGPLVNVEQFPYAVALLSCSKRSNGSILCAQFCSGSLITPSTVLTAGHCVHDATSRFMDSQPPVSLDSMYVMMGTENPRVNVKAGQQLVKVKSVSNLGFGLNKRFVTDGDIGIVHLDSCAEIILGQVETVKVATLDNETASTADSCVKINAFGFGKASNLPSEVANSDGQLRGIDDALHAFETCQEAYVEASLILQGFEKSVLETPENASLKEFFYSYVTPEMQLCHGGNSVHATCSGDSGGGVIEGPPDFPVLVGVTSFGLGEFCGFGPEYISRAASHAKWILEKIETDSVSCGDSWKNENAFTSWPVPELAELSDLAKASRCIAPNQWQCVSGECIGLEKVCDATADCSDDSDELLSFCPVNSSSSSKSALRSGTFDSPILTESQAESEAELDRLIAEWENAQGRRLSEDLVNVVVVGSLESVHRPTPPQLTLIAPPQSPHAQLMQLSSEVESDESCDGLESALEGLIAAEKEHGRNSAEQDPTVILNACNVYNFCIASAGGNDLSLSTFCTSFQKFVANRNMAYQFVASFDSRFNNACAAPVSATGIPPLIPLEIITAPPTTKPEVELSNPPSLAPLISESTTKSASAACVCTLALISLLL